MMRIGCFLLFALCASGASADLVTSIVPTQFQLKPGDLATFDLSITSENFMPTTFDFYVANVRAEGIQFRDVSTLSPYVLPSGQGTATLDPLPSLTTLSFGDQLPNLNSTFEPFDVLFEGETKGIARIEFQVPLGTRPGPITLLYGADFRDHDPLIPGGVFSYAVRSGSATIHVTAVPEPSALWLVGLVSAAAIGLSRRRTSDGARRQDSLPIC